MQSNGIQIDNTPNIIVITDSDQNQITVTQPITSVIEVAALGPQGPVGPQGLTGPSGSTQPFSLTGSIWASTASLAASGSFSGSFYGDGSQLTGIVSSKWTGSNPISRDLS